MVSSPPVHYVAMASLRQAQDPLHKQKLMGMRIVTKKYELIPLVGLVSMVVVGAAAFTFYAAWQKPDVRLNKYKRDEQPPWEEVNPEQPQKLINYKQTYNRIPELDKLREEIGSYSYGK